MTVLFERSFLKNIRRVKDEKIKEEINTLIDEIKRVQVVQSLPNVKKLKRYSSAYRIRIGDYRLGFFLEENQIIMSRFLHRKDIYEFFP